MQQLWITYLVVFGILGLSACNTMHGFGQDVEKTGEAIQRKAD